MTYRIEHSAGGLWKPLSGDAIPAADMLYLSDALNTAHNKTWIERLEFTVPGSGRYRITKCSTGTPPTDGHRLRFTTAAR